MEPTLESTLLKNDGKIYHFQWKTPYLYGHVQELFSIELPKGKWDFCEMKKEISRLSEISWKFDGI